MSGVCLQTSTNVYVLPPTVGGEGNMFSGRRSVRPLSVICPLTPISRDAISLYLVDGFQWNLLQIFILWLEIAEKVFKVIGQMSRSCVQMCERYNGGGIHYDSVSSKLACRGFFKNKICVLQNATDSDKIWHIASWIKLITSLKYCISCDVIRVFVF